MGKLTPLRLKPVPVKFAAVMDSEPVPVFDSVTVLLVDVPSRTLPKLRVVGDALNENVLAAVAEPDKVIAGAVFDALLETVIDPVKVPVVVGANLTLSAADWPAAIVIGKLAPEMLKPVPLTVAPVTERFDPPVFATVRV